MPRTKTVSADTQEVSKAETPRFQMSELGYTGLRVRSGMVHEELKAELAFPRSVITYKQMGYNATIAAALSYYEHMMLKSRPSFKPHALANDEQKAYADFLNESINDMEHSFQDFLQEVSSMNQFGFSVHEIVLRKRLNSKGSKYNDGKIGIQSLPIRAQDTISEWLYSNDGRKLIGLKQSLGTASTNGRVVLNSIGEKITIPREKFLLFRLGKRKDSPVGESPLKACYYSWKYLTEAELQEGVGLQRDLSGIAVAYVPPQIMADDASDSDKKQYQDWKNIVRNTQNNQQSGLVLPLIYDEVTKQPLYKLELLKNDGGKAYDTSKIKAYYVNSILTTLSADLLIMGQNTTGSYALGSIKGSLAAIAIEAKLREISNVFNSHLIPLLAKYNNWDLTRLPTLEFEDLESIDQEEFSKYVQRIGATGYLPKTKEVIDKVLDGMGLDKLPDDANLDELLPQATTRSGDGMKTSGEGTSNKIGGQDSSANNMDNAS